MPCVGWVCGLTTHLIGINPLCKSSINTFWGQSSQDMITYHLVPPLYHHTGEHTSCTPYPHQTRSLINSNQTLCSFFCLQGKWLISIYVSWASLSISAQSWLLSVHKVNHSLKNSSHSRFIFICHPLKASARQTNFQPLSFSIYLITTTTSLKQEWTVFSMSLNLQCIMIRFTFLNSEFE